MQIPEGNPYSLDDHKAVYKALITRLDTEREIAFGTVGAALVHSGMKERFGYGKPKPFLEHFSEFMTFIDRVAGGVPQRWVVLHRVPEWDAELGISSANASAGQMVGACVEQMIGTSASAETTGRETTASEPAADSSMENPTIGSVATSGMAADGASSNATLGADSVEGGASASGFSSEPHSAFSTSPTHLAASVSAPTHPAASASAAPAPESPAAADAATPQSIAQSMAASDKYRAAPIDEATRAELEPSFRGFVFVPYASADGSVTTNG